MERALGIFPAFYSAAPIKRSATMTGWELRNKRRQLGCTQAQLAAKLGVKPNTVLCWERGRNPVPKVVELALARFSENGEPYHREQLGIKLGIFLAGFAGYVVSHSSSFQLLLEVFERNGDEAKSLLDKFLNPHVEELFKLVLQERQETQTNGRYPQRKSG